MIRCRDSCREMRRHYEMLLIACAVLVLALLFEVRADEHVVVAGLPDYPLPPTCLSRECFGVRCPGCGLTRSFVHLAHGNWSAAWQAHRLGWLLMAALLAQFPYRIVAMIRGGRSPLGSKLPTLFGYALIGLLFANWFLDLLTRGVRDAH
ncbi:MAG TPA: DUF2752 domain-containing protein [Gemmataceae bacterium]|nr:DUF2752 domain-containing protein [Gemmataceae bacterium]